jgi:hypothetical protein
LTFERSKKTITRGTTQMSLEDKGKTRARSTSSSTNQHKTFDYYSSKYFPDAEDSDEEVERYQSNRYYGIETNNNKQLHVYELFDENEFLKEMSIINTPTGISYIPPLSGTMEKEVIMWAHHPDAGLFRWNLFTQQAPFFKIPPAFFNEETSYEQFVKIDRSWVKYRFGGVENGDYFLSETCPELLPVPGHSEDYMVVKNQHPSKKNELYCVLADLKNECQVGKEFDLSQVEAYGKQESTDGKTVHPYQFRMMNKDSCFITTVTAREALISWVDVQSGKVKSTVGSSRLLDMIGKSSYYCSLDYDHQSNRLFAGDNNAHVTIADLRMDESKLKRTDVVPLQNQLTNAFKMSSWVDTGKEPSKNVNLLVKDNYVFTCCQNQIQVFDTRKFTPMLTSPLQVSLDNAGMNILREENSIWFNNSTSLVFAQFVAAEKKKYSYLKAERILSGHVVDYVVYKAA